MAIAPTSSYYPMWLWVKAATNRMLNLGLNFEYSSNITKKVVDNYLGARIPNGRMWERAAGGQGWGSFWKSTYEGFKEVPSEGGLNVFKNIWTSLKNIPEAAKGKIGTWNKIKACGGKLGPLANLALMVGFEIPNVYRSFTHKDGGIGTGAVETGKTAVKLGASMAGFAVGSAAGGIVGAKVGAAVGTAICPGLGSLVGGVIGFAGGIIGSMFAGKVADAVVGKSFTEKQEEKAQKAAAAQAQAEAQPEMPQNTGGLNPFAMQQGGGASQGLATNPMLQMQQMQNFKSLAQMYNEYMMMQAAMGNMPNAGGRFSYMY